MNSCIVNFRSLKHWLERDSTVVLFSGDSMSYNQYGFETEFKLNAYDCFPGMASWSFLLRDRLWSNTAGYIKGDTLAAKHACISGEGTIRCGYDRAYVFPQYGQVLVYEGKAQGGALEIRYPVGKEDKLVFYMLSNPMGTACTFDVTVNGRHAKRVNNAGAGKAYQGFEPFVFDVPLKNKAEGNCLIRFENLMPNEGDRGAILLAGIAEKTVTVHMTGQGSTTCQWLDDHCKERITDYRPDLVFLTLAANDIRLSSPEVFETSLLSVVKKTRDANPDCAFVFLPAPPSARDDPFTSYDGWIYNRCSEVKDFYSVLNALAVKTHIQRFKNRVTYYRTSTTM